MHNLADIADELTALVGAVDGPPTPLEGGITNSNLLVTAGGERYVVRRPGKDTALLGIDRETEVAANRAAAEIGIAPDVIGMAGECLVTRFVSSRALRDGELAGRAAELGEILRRFHACGVRLATVFDVGQLLDHYEQLAVERGATVDSGYMLARESMARIDDALGPRERVPSHNDLLAGNLLVTDEDRMMIVDWEYAGRGDALFDLGNAVVNNGLDSAAAERMLAGHDASPPSEARRAQLELMAVASDAREAAWGVLQGCLSELDFDFAGYAEQHFARLRASVEDSSFERALQAAGAVWKDPRHGLQAT